MKNLSLALAGLLLAVLAAPAVAADDVSVAPPNPCYYTQCPPPCLACPPPVCLSCIIPATCDLEDRECHPEPMDWACTTGPSGLGGVIGATVDYAFTLALIGCVVSLSEANVALDATGDTTYYAYMQAQDTADFVLGSTLSIPTNEVKPAVQALQDTVGYEFALVCSFLLGPSACTGPAPLPGACPVDLPDAGGVVGAALATAEAGCAAAQGGASAAAGHAVEAARDVAFAVSVVLRNFGGHANEVVDGAEAHAANLEGHANDAAGVALWGAQAGYTATCGYLFGACPV
ncbi:MAG: hypothetical protein QOD77_691 [Thermoplasmata archaeon]|jgi:hypothetical protein|nr:hypothetical protein [Thermoplasmata archaeon]